MQTMGLPATPFDHRRAPAEGPATAIKAAAPTPGGGLPATTPLAAEVLASLNAVAGADDSAAAPAGPGAAAVAPPLPATADQAEGDAAATLSGLLGGGLEPRLSAAESSRPHLVQQQGQTQQQQQPAPALARLFQEAALAPPPPAMHSAAMAAAAAALAAGPALPVPRRQSAATAPAALLSIPGVQQREQRPCNCKRSMCLKMYCECFAAGEQLQQPWHTLWQSFLLVSWPMLHPALPLLPTDSSCLPSPVRSSCPLSSPSALPRLVPLRSLAGGFCAPSCSCLSCSNTPAEMAAVQAAREVVLAKNPNAFEVKVSKWMSGRLGGSFTVAGCLSSGAARWVARLEWWWAALSCT